MLTKLTPADFGPEFQDKLTTQGYGGGTRIEGVRLLDLRLMSDDGGTFAELVRFDESGNLEAIPDFKVRQSSYSLVLPGAIKAFHLHYNQEDVWFVPPTDRLLVGLVDARRDSPTYNKTMRFVMGGGKAQLALHPARGGAWRREHLAAAGDDPLLCQPAVRPERPRRAPPALGHRRSRLLADDAGVGTMDWPTGTG